MIPSWFQARIILLVCLSKVPLSHQTYQDTYTKILYKWKTVEFNYPTSKAREDAIQRGEFNPNNVLIMDSDVHVQGCIERHFVTTPPIRTGTPATLSQVLRRRGENVLEPFPSWPNRTNLCRGPVTVFRIFIDKCGLMWVIDTGSSNIEDQRLSCPPKLLVYDLNDEDREVVRYEFPQSVVSVVYDRRRLLNIITESYKRDCSDSVAYIADARGPALIVFDYASRTSWRIENRLFYPYPQHSTLTSNGVTVQFTDGLLGLALGPLCQRDRKLYFHSLVSVRESWAPVHVLKNRKLSQDPAVQRTAFVESSGERTNQSTVEVMTKDAIMLYPLLSTNELVCWNSNEPFVNAAQHVLKRDDENFQFISGMKLMQNDTLIITSNRFPNFVAGRTDPMEYNYRMIVIED